MFFVQLDSMTLGLAQTEPNLVWIFRGFQHEVIHQTHFLKSGSPGEEKREQVSIQKEPEYMWLGGQGSCFPS